MVIKNNAERPYIHFIEFSLMVISCKAIIQYHNKHIDFDIIRIQNSSITVRMCF